MYVYYSYSNQTIKNNIFVMAWWRRMVFSSTFHIFFYVFLTFVTKIIYSKIKNIKRSSALS